MLKNIHKYERPECPEHFKPWVGLLAEKNEENIVLEVEGVLQNCPIDFNVKFSQKLKSGSPLKLDNWKSVEAIEKHVPRELELYMSRGDDRWNGWKRLKNEGVDGSQRRWSSEDSRKGRVFLKICYIFTALELNFPELCKNHKDLLKKSTCIWKTWMSWTIKAWNGVDRWRNEENILLEVGGVL